MMFVDSDLLAVASPRPTADQPYRFTNAFNVAEDGLHSAKGTWCRCEESETARCTRRHLVMTLISAFRYQAPRCFYLIPALVSLFVRRSGRREASAHRNSGRSHFDILMKQFVKNLFLLTVNLQV